MRSLKKVYTAVEEAYRTAVAYNNLNKQDIFKKKAYTKVCSISTCKALKNHHKFTPLIAAFDESDGDD